jgi:uncharacterized protein YutE (UPF0331/DUF86 family)
MNDILINKIVSIQRCIERAREEFRAAPASFDTDYTRQDAAILNILRACELSIDLANHMIKTRKLGIPTSSAESFGLLEKRGVIDGELCERLSNMVHFRNTIIHEYKRMNLDIMKAVITSGLDDLVVFGDRVREFAKSSGP